MCSPQAYADLVTNWESYHKTDRRIVQSLWTGVKLEYDELYKLVLLDSLHDNTYRDDDASWLADIGFGVNITTEGVEHVAVTEAIFPPDAPYNSKIYPIPKAGAAKRDHYSNPNMDDIEARYGGDDLGGAYGSGNRGECEEPINDDKHRFVTALCLRHFAQEACVACAQFHYVGTCLGQ